VIHVLDPGPRTLIQDQGRPGYAELGVGRAGAADRGSLRSANRLVGNPPHLAGLEIANGGLLIELTAAATLALTGAGCPANVDFGVALSLPAGARITLGRPGTGLRTYLAVRGGIDVDPVLGSRSYDTLSGIGPDPLRPGDRLRIGPGGPHDVIDAVVAARVPGSPLRVLAGPRDDWFEGGVSALLGSSWMVRADSDRIGTRLDGPPLIRWWHRRDDELPSEATRPGALQIPPDGRPILLGPDAPVTGGYPVVAVVHSADLDHAGQLRPGQIVRFRVLR
jgi:biotin-dependent carboxylase-like uncharacterized protein